MNQAESNVSQLMTSDQQPTAEPTVVFLCQDVPARQNSTRYQRAKLVCDEFSAVILARDEVCPSVESEAESVQVCTIPFYRLLYPLWLFIQILWLRRRHPIGYIHTTNSPQTLVVGFFLQLVGHVWVADIWDDPRLGIDIEGRPNGLGRWMSRLYNRLLLFIVIQTLSRADLIIIALVPEILEDYNIQPSNSSVLPVTNGVDLDATRPVRSRQLSVSGAAVRVLYLGPIREARGVDLLIDAVISADHAGTAVDLQLVGGMRKQDQQWLDHYTSDIAFEQSTITAPGAVPHDEALAAIANADICICLLSPTVRNYYYAYPIKIFEYMALERPIICTRMAGTQRILTDGESAFFVPPNNAIAIADAIERLATDSELRMKLGQQAGQAVTAYDWQYINRRLRDHLRKCISTEGP